MLYYLILYARLMLFMFLGIFIANAAMELGLLKYISKPLEPLTKAAKLPNDAAMIPAIFLFNATAAHATLASFLNKKLVNEEEAITAVLISSAAMRTRTLFQYYLPIAVPALGFMLAAKVIAQYPVGLKKFYSSSETMKFRAHIISLNLLVRLPMKDFEDITY
ncbi:MAG: hypothetical protein QMD80_08985 [archaeon]|nr:hypothetical protein [archaeon]